MPEPIKSPEARTESAKADSVKRVVSRARELCERLREIHDDPRYRAVWEIAQLHRGPYDGPQYEAELLELECELLKHG